MGLLLLNNWFLLNLFLFLLLFCPLLFFCIFIRAIAFFLLLRSHFLLFLSSHAQPALQSLHHPLLLLLLSFILATDTFFSIVIFLFGAFGLLFLSLFSHFPTVR